MKSQVGILLLDTEKTFGRFKNKLLYKCLPGDKTLEPIQIPYNIQWGFSKHAKNKFIRFSLHPTIPGQGQIEQIFGDVDDLIAWNEYQIFYRGLNLKQTKQIIFDENKETAEKVEKNIIDRCDEFVFTVDNENTEDYDDAFSISETRFSIYITNVAEWIHNNNPKLLQNLSECPPATIYLPHRRIPLLPKNCNKNFSLCKGETRLCIGLDVFFGDNNQTILKTEWNPFVKIIVKKNYYYGENVNNKYLSNLIQITNHQINVANTTTTTTTTTTLQKCVAYWMEFYCGEAGKILFKKQCGIFLNRKPWNPDILLKLSEIHWTPHVQYLPPNSTEIIKPYTQITSPIRKYIDIYNQYCLLYNDDFCSSCCRSLEKINQQMRQIRKLQMESYLLKRCCALFEKSKEHLFSAIIIENYEKNGKYKYTIFLEELNLLSVLTVLQPLTEKNTGDKIMVQMFLFCDEHSLKRKIKFNCCECE
jgi:hypothetical protein